MASGYVTDTTYADTFFRELSPAWLNYVGALNGVAPIPLDEPFTYLELGCGHGTSSIVNAGAFPHAEFHACDFNPEHVDFVVVHGAHPSRPFPRLLPVPLSSGPSETSSAVDAVAPCRL